MESLNALVELVALNLNICSKMQSPDSFYHSRLLLLTFLIVSLTLFSNGAQAVTLKEFQHTLKIVHDTCQTMTKVKEELIQQVRDGTFVDDPVIKCYVHCFMEMLHLMNGTVGQFHVANQHTDYMIPAELFDTTIKAFGHCEGATNGMTDNCEAAYTMLKCFKADNNEFWFR